MSPDQEPQEPRMLPLVEDIKYISPETLDSVRYTIFEARRKVEGLIDNGQGQGLLLPTEEMGIPADLADEIIEKAQAELSGTGVELVKTPDSVRVVKKWERTDPWEDIGYKR